MKAPAHYRQGDILLIRLPKGGTIPKAAKPVAGRDGRLILAEGEATGHHHSIADIQGRMKSIDDLLFLQIPRGECASLEHQEHATIELAPGNYRVVRQVEWTDEGELQRVAD